MRTFTTAISSLIGLVLVAGCGGSGAKTYSATDTAACLRHRPEAHRLSSVSPPGMRVLQLRVMSAPRAGPPFWAKKNAGVPALIMNFFPATGREPVNIAKASFFGDQRAASAYYRSALAAARSAYPSPPWDLSRFVDQRRNVVIEWNSETPPSTSGSRSPA